MLLREDGGGARVASSNARQAKPKGLVAKAALSGKGNCLECTTSLDSLRWNGQGMLGSDVFCLGKVESGALVGTLNGSSRN